TRTTPATMKRTGKNSIAAISHCTGHPSGAFLTPRPTPFGTGNAVVLGSDLGNPFLSCQFIPSG
ncbi:hypothetical protein ACCS96_38670, partial [Rhizobium ruizarguesonis]